MFFEAEVFKFSHLLYWSAYCLFACMIFHSSSTLMPIALLICMENTFWYTQTSKDVNFVELFRKSFKLYAESGMRKKTGVDINVLKKELHDRQTTEVSVMTEDFKAKFYMFIAEHYLCKIHFYLHSTHHSLTSSSPIYSPWSSFWIGTRVYSTTKVDAKNP